MKLVCTQLNINKYNIRTKFWFNFFCFKSGTKHNQLDLSIRVIWRTKYKMFQIFFKSSKVGRLFNIIRSLILPQLYTAKSGTYIRPPPGGVRIFTLPSRGGRIDHFCPFLPKFASFFKYFNAKIDPQGGAVAPQSMVVVKSDHPLLILGCSFIILLRYLHNVISNFIQ